MSADYAHVPRPPPPGSGVVASVRRHYDYPPPTALSTTVNAGYHSTPGAGQTPSTASSTLSSPFVGYAYNNMAASPDAPSSTTSPLGSSSASLTYDPSAWGQAPPPPPPYSPRHADLRQDERPPTEQARPSPVPILYRPSIQGPGGGPSREVVSEPRRLETPPAPGPALSFPPPPSTSSGRRARSSSRTNERPQPLFSLSGLSSRVRSGPQGSGSSRPDEAGARSGPPLADTTRRPLTLHAGSSRGGPNYDGHPPPSCPPPPPPTSRRSASTGALAGGQGGHRPQSERRSPTRTAWEPGMPLPPPPPGPPPTSRSQSLNRSMGLSPGEEPCLRPETGMSTRRLPTTRSNLPPIPPTPAGWVDTSEVPPVPTSADHASSAGMPVRLIEGLEHDLMSGDRSPNDALRNEHPGASSPSSPALDPPPKGIRERRNQSRTRKGAPRRQGSGDSERSDHPWTDEEMNRSPSVGPVNLVLLTNGPGLTRRPALTKSSPRSPRRLSSTDGRRQGPTSSAMFPADQNPNSLLAFGNEPDRVKERPVSHLLHTDNVGPLMPSPLTPSRPSSAQTNGAFDADTFAREAVERHRVFAEREAAMATDRERVLLFIEFVMRESHLRRRRYADAVDDMGSQILELTRDLFRPDSNSDGPSSPPSPRRSRPSPKTSLDQVVHDAFKNPAPSTSVGARPDSNWWGAYMPSLSPIPSMSASLVPDEMSSRGRTPSRWWEASQTGSIAGGGRRGVERSKRESKYMGLPLRDWEDTPSIGHSTIEPTSQTLEYPPEKLGGHDPVTPRSSDPGKLDVSRLVTLPPPYPRHYPAVNNNHPDLAELRIVVRGLNDMTEIVRVKQEFAGRHGEEDIEADRRRRQRLEDVRKLVETGRMSYAEAASVEEGETRKVNEARRAEFARYQMEVVQPLQELLSQRIATAATSFETLKGQLWEHNPVEEGDEKPELLEKLTLLKWVFEAQEQLHRESYDVSSAGSERYQRLLASSHTDDRKPNEMKAFFERDERQRQAQFEKNALARFEHFTDVVELTVEKAVEVQLSTFWDIAPPLVEVIQKVRVEKGVQANAEYDFSQQYLWEVLTHAEKSVYQFIEAQINLLCLLHEVKSGMTKQSGRSMVAQRRLAGQGEDDMDKIVRAAEGRLTADLKEKVRTVEEQWQEAMGQVVGPLKDRVRSWLQHHGGWEGLEDD